ncbi:MAG: DUF5691 domain-containing protein [Cyanobacteria bacterium J06643_4]
MWTSEQVLALSPSASAKNVTVKNVTAKNAITKNAITKSTTQPKTAQQKRAEKVAAGLIDLEQWLQDMIRQGLAELPNAPYSFWDQAAARLVDAQAPGLARRVQELAGILHSGEGWPERLLKALGELSVLAQSFQNSEVLSEAMQAEVRSQIGFTQKKADLVEQSEQGNPLVRSLKDTWHVLGKRILKEDALKMQRVWLWGIHNQKAALILSFAHGRRQKLDTSLLPGSCFDGELVFYPGTGVQRAVVVSRQGAATEKKVARSGIGVERVEDAIAHYAQSLTENPWQNPFPLTLANVKLRYQPTPTRTNHWWIEDSEGSALPVCSSFEQGWEILAMSGGRPLTIFGEWDRDNLMPLSVWSKQKFLALDHSPTPPTPQRNPSRHPSRYQSELIAGWQKLVSAALIGTDRQMPALSSEKSNEKSSKKISKNSELNQLLYQLDWAQPEAALLQAAGTLSLYERVGYRHAVSLGKIATQNNNSESIAESNNLEHVKGSTLAKPDVQPCCSDRTARQLQKGLTHYPQALSELLSLLATAGQRVPAKHLPALLRLGRKNTDLQPLIEAVIDNRGRWLAEKNPDWHYASVHIQEIAQEISVDALEQQKTEWVAQWKSGDRQQRTIAIRSWRRIDPAGAREAIVETWKGENWRERESAIALFNIGLSMEDEPFLEAALCDRAQAVRQQAAQHLSKLPGSKWCQRMANRAKDLVQLTTNHKLNITLTLPKTFDPAWEKDGLSKKAISGLGEQASWLQQLIASTPLSEWNIDIAALATTLTTHPDRELLIHSWAQAICNQQHEDIARVWAPALLNQFSAYAWNLDQLTVLVSLLPTPQKEQYLRSQLPPQTNDQNSAHWLKLVAQCQASWDYPFSQLILKQLAQVIKRKHKYGTVFSPPTSLALTLHPGLAPEAAKTIGEIMVDRRAMRSWQRFADEFVGLLEYRWAMYQAFAGSG